MSDLAYEAKLFFEESRRTFIASAKAKNFGVCDLSAEEMEAAFQVYDVFALVWVDENEPDGHGVLIIKDRSGDVAAPLLRMNALACASVEIARKIFHRFNIPAATRH